MKNIEIVRFFNHAGEVKKKKLPVKIGFALNRNLATLEGIAADYNRAREEILKKHCIKDAEGNYLMENEEYVIPDKSAYTEEMEELLNFKNEVQIQKVTMEDMEKCDSEKFDSLTPEELELLSFMIEE